MCELSFDLNITDVDIFINSAYMLNIKAFLKK